MKLRKWRIVLWAVMLLTFIKGVNAEAYENVNMDKKGSISITMQYNESAVSGGTMTFHKVGNVSTKNSKVGFALTDEFEGSKIALNIDDMNDDTLAETAVKLSDYADKNNVTGRTLGIDQEGYVLADQLEVGLYLIVQKEPATGFQAVLPFLVSVPVNVNGSYVYDVNATPKMSALTTKPSTPDTPGTTPDTPGTTPDTPGTTPDTPGTTPDTPGTTPDTPGTTPDTPGTTPDTPGTTPDTPGTTPDTPETTPDTPGTTPDTPTTPSESGTTTSTSNTSTLPQTGQLKWPIPVMAMLGLILLLYGCFLRSGKEDTYEA